MPTLLYDPATWEIVADPAEYRIEAYNPGSYQVIRLKDESSYIVDVKDRRGAGSCTCGDYLTHIDERSETETCKHIRLIFFLRRLLADRKALAKKRSIPVPRSSRPRNAVIQSTDKMEVVGDSLLVNGREFIVASPGERIVGIQGGKLVTQFRGSRHNLWPPDMIVGHYSCVQS